MQWCGQVAGDDERDVVAAAVGEQRADDRVGQFGGCPVVCVRHDGAQQVETVVDDDTPAFDQAVGVEHDRSTGGERRAVLLVRSSSRSAQHRAGVVRQQPGSPLIGHQRR